jgi:hypothetical protein
MKEVLTSKPMSIGYLAVGSYLPAVKLISDAFMPTNLGIEKFVIYKISFIKIKHVSK